MTSSVYSWNHFLPSLCPQRYMACRPGSGMIAIHIIYTVHTLLRLRRKTLLGMRCCDPSLLHALPLFHFLQAKRPGMLFWLQDDGSRKYIQTQ